MLEILDTADDVLALRIGGRITGGDLDAVMDRLEEALHRDEKLHIFVETSAIESIEISALPRYTARAVPLFGKLGRIDRVAVVADRRWIRLATRIESAMVPFITYRVFEPTQRAEALKWAARGDRPA